MESSQIVSQKRVADHGEVFTAEREVKAMCDLVKSETERIDSRFLEPACGKGVFLAEILRRKLAVVKVRYQKVASDYERYAFLALSSIYGIDILKDNVDDCREELFKIFKEEFEAALKIEPSAEYERAIKFLLLKNIVWGDALTLMRVDEPDKPIVFSEWSFVDSVHIQRRDFSFSNLLDCSVDGLPLFSDLGEEVWQPKPVKEFAVCHYLEVAEGDGLLRGLLRFARNDVARNDDQTPLSLRGAACGDVAISAGVECFPQRRRDAEGVSVV